MTCPWRWRESRLTGACQDALLVQCVLLNALYGAANLQNIISHDSTFCSHRNFANKLWNAGKYIENCLGPLGAADRQALAVRGPLQAAELQTLQLPERYIVSRCHEVAAKVSARLP